MLPAAVLVVAVVLNAVAGSTINTAWLEALPVNIYAHVLSFLGPVVREILLADLSRRDLRYAVALAAHFNVGRTFTDRLFDRESTDFDFMLERTDCCTANRFVAWAFCARFVSVPSVPCAMQHVLEAMHAKRSVQQGHLSLVHYLIDCNRLHLYNRPIGVDWAQKIAKSLTGPRDIDTAWMITLSANNIESITLHEMISLFKNHQHVSSSVLYSLASKALWLHHAIEFLMLSIDAYRFDVLAIALDTLFNAGTYRDQCISILQRHIADIAVAVESINDKVETHDHLKHLWKTAASLGFIESARRIFMWAIINTRPLVRSLDLYDVCTSMGVDFVSLPSVIRAIGPSRILAMAEISLLEHDYTPMKLDSVLQTATQAGGTYATAAKIAFYESNPMEAYIIYTRHSKEIDLGTLLIPITAAHWTVSNSLRVYKKWVMFSNTKVSSHDPMDFFLANIKSIHRDAIGHLLVTESKQLSTVAPRVRAWLKSRTNLQTNIPNLGSCADIVVPVSDKDHCVSRVRKAREEHFRKPQMLTHV